VSRHHEPHPSSWVERFADRVPPGAVVLDVACGAGRHGRFFLGRGHPVVLVDRDVSAVADLAGRPGVEIVHADLEDGSPWPFGARTFGAVVVTRYLWRPTLPSIVAAVAPGGVLLYETFARGHERFGRPTNPDFLLRPGELLDVVQPVLEVVAYEALEIAEPQPAVVQRVAAVRP
jgi:SAM-dependent methyltransferase